jgi:hypothetical protein
VGFLAIWFVVLWMLIRWHTQRRVNRLLARWQGHDPALDLAISPVAAALEWSDQLLEPIHAARRHADALITRTETLRASLSSAA